jgi:ornithine cyclodeaminase/alanine dehydrogenase-like protein (mu-crystallin family)
MGEAWAMIGPHSWGRAAQALALAEIETVAVIGPGTQGREQLRALNLVRRFRTSRIYDSRPERAFALVLELRKELEADLTLSSNLRSTGHDRARDAHRGGRRG